MFYKILKNFSAIAAGITVLFPLVFLSLESTDFKALAPVLVCFYGKFCAQNINLATGSCRIVIINVNLGNINICNAIKIHK